MINMFIGVIVALFLVVFLLLFRVQSLMAIQRGSGKKPGLTNRLNASLFMVSLFVGTFAGIYYTVTGDYTLPLASEHGENTDNLFYITIAIISIVVVLTHILLFGFSYKYQWREDRKAKFYPDNHKLELIWTVIPAIVLTYLVFMGWKVWSDITMQRDANKVVEVEAVAEQFAWTFRYPGEDKVFGKHNFREIDATNTLGIDFTDAENEAAFDDFVERNTLVIPKGQEVRIRIRAKDVLHSFYLPHFRVKMDAVPGTPTSFTFTATKTTDEMRKELAASPRWQELDANGEPKYKNFKYELACAEICGPSHYNMRREVKVVSQDEYKKWCKAQKKWSESNEAYFKKKAEVASEEGNEEEYEVFKGILEEYFTKKEAEKEAIQAPVSEEVTEEAVESAS